MLNNNISLQHILRDAWISNELREILSDFQIAMEILIDPIPRLSDWSFIIRGLG